MTPGKLGNVSSLTGSLQWGTGRVGGKHGEQNATPSAAADFLTYTLTKTNLCLQIEILDCKLPWVCDACTLQRTSDVFLY